MNTNKEKVIDLKGVFRDFIGNSNVVSDDKKNVKEFLEWKKANKVTDKNIIDLEKIVPPYDRQKQGNKKVRKNSVNESNNIRNIKSAQTEILDFDAEVEKLDKAGQEDQSRGA